MHPRFTRYILAVALLAASLVAATAQAAIINKYAIINGAQEPTNSQGGGTATIVIDTDLNTLSYNITYGGLSAAETAAHIHGFAPRGTNVGILHTLPTTSGTKVGTWNYLDAQEANILAGLTYINIHTTAFPGGEIRGQIDKDTPLPASSPIGFMVLASALIGAGALWMVWRRRATA